MGRLPDFVIIGAMKCATTTLHAQLERQPGIFVHGPGETEFFSRDDQYARGLEWYVSLFEGSGGAALCGERSTQYTKLPTYHLTVARMSRHLRDVRLVYIIRHPIDRVASHYSHEWLLGRITGPIDESMDSHPELIDWSRYAMQVEPYLQAFGPEKVLLVGFERLIRHPQAELERICRFIGYRREPRWDESAGARNVSSERLRRSPLRDRLLGIPILDAARRRIVPKPVREHAKKFWRLRARPELSARRVAALHPLFDEDLARLGKWLGLDLSCESFRATVESTPLNWAEDLRV